MILVPSNLKIRLRKPTVADLLDHTSSDMPSFVARSTQRLTWTDLSSLIPWTAVLPFCMEIHFFRHANS